MQLSVREMNQSDIDKIINYWLGSNETHLKNMGVDINKLPSKEALQNMLNQQLQFPIEQKRSYCMIWQVNGEAVGHCNTNPTHFGNEAYMHLHLWHNNARQKGLGTTFVKMTLPYFFINLKLKKLVSEPYAFNAAPNKTLEKAGFELEKEYKTTPGALSFEQPVKRWIMTGERFKTLYA